MAEQGEGIIHCSFCGKSQHEVRKLIAGQRAFICDECVAHMVDGEELPSGAADMENGPGDESA